MRICTLPLIAIALFAAHPAAADAIRYLELPQSCADYAIDPTNGQVVGVDPLNNRCVVYGADVWLPGKTAKPLATLTVGNRPASIVFKQTEQQRLFIIACLSDNNLYVVDAATLKQTAKILVTGSDVSGLAVSLNERDATVYYNYGRGHDSAAGRVDLVRNIDEGLAFDDSMDCAISADGEYAYRRGPWSPSGFEVLRKVADPKAGSPKFVRVFYDHDSRGQYLPDPFGLYTATGKNLYPKELGKSVATLQASPVAFFPDRPMIVGLSGDSLYDTFGSRGQKASAKLVIASYNTYRNVVERELPAEFSKPAEEQNFAGPGQADFKYVGHKLKVFIDPPRDRIVLVRDKRAAVASIKELQLPDEPFLIISTASNEPLLIDRPNIVGLKTRDGRIKVELVDKIDGLALTARGLEWTPDASQIGPRKLRMRLSHGELERMHEIPLMVERPHTALPFAASRAALAPDAKVVALWTAAGGDPMMEMRNRQTPENPQLAVVDLAAGKVLASKTLAFPVSVAALDEHAVYVVQTGSGVLTVLSRSDLSEQKQVALESPIVWLQPVRGALAAGLVDGRWIKYSTPDMKLVAEHLYLGNNGMVDPMGRGRQLAQRGPLRTAEGWGLNTGDVYDGEFSRPVLLRNVGLTARIGGMSATASGNEQEFFDQGMQGFHGGSEPRVVGTARLISPPVQMRLIQARVTEQTPGAIHTSRTTESWTLAAMVGKLAAQPTTTLTLKKSDYLPDQTARTTGCLVLGPEQAHCVIDDRLYSIPLSPLLGAGPETKGFRFAMKQSAFVVDASGTKLTHEVVDAAKPVQFALATPQTGVQIDSATGEVSVNLATLTNVAIEQWVKVSGNGIAVNRVGPPFASLEQVDAYVQQQAKFFEQTTGRKPRGVPATLHIHVQATDATPNTARLQYEVLVEVPREKIDEKVNQAAAELQKMIAARETARAAGGGGGEGDASSPETAARIRKLEERIIALEAQLGVLMRIIEARGR